jgi:hypothetical protein
MSWHHWKLVLNLPSQLGDWRMKDLRTYLLVNFEILNEKNFYVFRN